MLNPPQVNTSLCALPVVPPPQDVIRNWHSREVNIVKTVRGLVENAQKARRAIEAGEYQQLVHPQSVSADLALFQVTWRS